MNRSSVAVSSAIVVVGAGLLGACGYGAESAAGPSTAYVRQQAQVESTAPDPTKITVTEAGELGEVLTDGEGRTLYRSTQDTADPPRSNCEGDCANAWPPLLAEGSVTVAGVSQELVGTVSRSDGTEQVTVDGWPVYTYAQDSAPGQAAGHGMGEGQWSAIGVDGEPAAGGGLVAINTTEIAGLGKVLTDGGGNTLYLFKEDSTKPPKATCEGECAQAWPPVLVEGDVGDVAVEGLDAALVGTVERPDGTTQLTVGGWPMYTFAKDAGPGDAAGHGAKGTWFAVEPNGCAVAEDKRPEEAGSSGSDY